MGEKKIKEHRSSLADLFADAYWLAKVRLKQKNIIYPPLSLISSAVPLLSRMCLRSPDEICKKDFTVKCGVRIKAGHVHFYFYFKIYLSVSGLSCGTRNLVASCGIYRHGARTLWCSTWAPECMVSVAGALRLNLFLGVWDPSSPARDWTHVPCIAGKIFNHWTTREVLGHVPFRNSSQRVLMLSHDQVLLSERNQGVRMDHEGKN